MKTLQALAYLSPFREWRAQQCIAQLLPERIEFLRFVLRDNWLRFGPAFAYEKIGQPVERIRGLGETLAQGKGILVWRLPGFGR